MCAKWGLQLRSFLLLLPSCCCCCYYFLKYFPRKEFPQIFATLSFFLCFLYTTKAKRGISIPKIESHRKATSHDCQKPLISWLLEKKGKHLSSYKFPSWKWLPLMSLKFIYNCSLGRSLVVICLASNSKLPGLFSGRICDSIKKYTLNEI